MGSALQLTLNSVYYLSQPIENLPYTEYMEFFNAKAAGRNGTQVRRRSRRSANVTGSTPTYIHLNDETRRSIFRSFGLDGDTVSKAHSRRGSRACGDAPVALRRNPGQFEDIDGIDRKHQ